jgi:predicted N-acetyltransferase YhbS
MPLTGPRGARAQEIPAVVRLANTVFRADGETSMGEEYPLLYAPENSRNLRLFLDGGTPVSLVGMLEREVSLLGTRHRCCEIGSVCTHPDYREDGLATRLLKDARRRAVEHGCDMFLISGGRGLYCRLGYVDVGGYVRITVDTDDLPRGAGVRNRPRADADLPALVDLHSAEPVRFVRPPEDFRTLLEGECTLNGRAETRLILTGDARPVAYVMFRPPGSRGVEENELCIDELAGSRLAVAHALPPLFDEFDLDRLHIEALSSDHELAYIAATHGWDVQPQGFHGTVGIIDPDRFWQSIVSLVHERLGEEANDLALDTDGRQVNLNFGSEKTPALNMPGFTRLVFLPEHKREAVDPALSQDSPLKRILARLFPLPLVSYGLNYV